MRAKQKLLEGKSLGWWADRLRTIEQAGTTVYVASSIGVHDHSGPTEGGADIRPNCGQWFQKEVLPFGETRTIGDDCQLTIYDSYTVEGALTINGRLIVWGGAAAGPGAAAGNDTEIQYNERGVLGASALLAWDRVNGQLLVFGAGGIELTNTLTINLGNILFSGDQWIGCGTGDVRILFDAGDDIALLGGLVGIGDSAPTTAQLVIVQPNSTGAIPVLHIRQTDNNVQILAIQGYSCNLATPDKNIAGPNIELNGAPSIYIQVQVIDDNGGAYNDTRYWMPLFTETS